MVGWLLTSSDSSNCFASSKFLVYGMFFWNVDPYSKLSLGKQKRPYFHMFEDVRIWDFLFVCYFSVMHIKSRTMKEK